MDDQVCPSKLSRILVEKVVKTPKKIGKREKRSKKNPKPVVEETTISSKEVVPTQTGVLKRLNKMTHKPRHSPERSKRCSPSFSFKPQVNRKGVIFREIPTPVSPGSKKRRAGDMAK